MRWKILQVLHENRGGLLWFARWPCDRGVPSKVRQCWEDRRAKFTRSLTERALNLAHLPRAHPDY